MNKSKKDQCKKLKITLIRSLSGRLKEHVATVQCLGLRKIHQSKEIENNPSTLGMVHKVSYLLKVEEI